METKFDLENVEFLSEEQLDNLEMNALESGKVKVKGDNNTVQNK
jgi:ferredoxin-fold anticodon binding domain-containing protein